MTTRKKINPFLLNDALARVNVNKFDVKVKKAWEHVRYEKEEHAEPSKKKKQQLREDAAGKPCLICARMLHYKKGEQLRSVLKQGQSMAATCEHKLPKNLGGDNEPENLTGQMCVACNRSRGYVWSRGPLNRNTKDGVEQYVRWIYCQLEDPVSAMILYPELHMAFISHWRTLTNEAWTSTNAGYDERVEEAEKKVGIPLPNFVVPAGLPITDPTIPIGRGRRDGRTPNRRRRSGAARRPPLTSGKDSQFHSNGKRG
jgi:hypothetical protein